ncbi:MAG: DEAD/DEAH box helicase family protein [Anaerolineales bacterium]|nr:DEAD/DEAH box helicase family protein [Anaerolineales bacterium]
MALFNETEHYGSAKFPKARPFQDSAHEALRAGAKAGHKNQCLMSPTGSGKTYLGLRIAHEALKRGKRAIFVCDRTTLIDQTSETADEYGLAAHSVLQANHWRYNATSLFQIASPQTLARRQWPEADVIIIDEAHTQMTVWTEHIMNTRARVIGLSATPFSPGLGKLFTNLVNATTMHELTQSGVLVPMIPYTCRPADMRGAATAGGEWTDSAAEERGMEIVGDVVAEWIKLGQNRKTIVFGSTIKHCEEICKQFSAVGVMAAMFTSETSAGERKALLAEYKKPDSTLRVLISVEALAKGFDVKDVGCIVDCRPLRKSLSTAIQMWGRGLRSSEETGKKDCVARGTLVLTHVGEIPIEHITLDHKVWDGQQFVNHAGTVCRGVREVIEYDGLVATPDHKVMTDDGWTRFEEAARRKRRIARTGIDGHAIRFIDDHLAHGIRQRQQPARRGRLRSLWDVALRVVPQLAQAAGHCGMPPLQFSAGGAGSEMAVRAMPSATQSLQQSEQLGIRALWWAGHRVSVLIRERSGPLGGGKSRRAGSGDAVGSREKQRPLRTRKSSLDDGDRKSEQHSRFWWAGTFHRVSQGFPWGSLRRRNAGETAPRPDARGDRQPLERALMQTEREVWDVLNAGPLQRFTANGRLVHNCILLDHTGNILRFADDYTDIYYNGLDALDMGEKLDKTIRRDDEEKQVSECPSCGFKPFGKRCMACGLERQTQSLVEHQPGEMEAVMLGKKKLADDQRHLFEQCATYARAHSKPDKQEWRAKFLYRDMTGALPPKGWSLAGTPDVVVSRNVLNKIRSLNIARSKGRPDAV